MSPYGVWSETQSDPALNAAGRRLALRDMLGGTAPSTHFVVDTSRDGQGPNDMQAYAAAPYNQPARRDIQRCRAATGATHQTLGSGRSQPQTRQQSQPLDSYLPANTSLLDAYLWVKTPGQSDGQCDIAGGVRDWQDYTSAGAGGGYTPSSGWPTSSSSKWTTFDPLWSLQTGKLVTDPAAGAWFPAQALQLAQNANPQLH